MKTDCLKINVSYAKTNILSDGKITVKVIFSVMQRDTRLFSRENMISYTSCHDGNPVARIAMCCQDGKGRFPVYRTSSPNLGKLA